MARVEITYKCVTIAREALRKGSMARITGRSVYIKRYYGRYKLIGVEVSAKQRKCRDLFAEAQKLAHKDLANWNRRRHWGRLARKHKVSGAHRMAVKVFYEMLKTYGRDAIYVLNRSRMIVKKSGVDRDSVKVVKMKDYIEGREKGREDMYIDVGERRTML